MLLPLLKFLVRVTPDAMTVAIASALSARTPRAPVTLDEQAAMQSARQLKLGTDQPYVAWQFDTNDNAAPLVVLVHGWGGRAAQMAPLALHLSHEGFRCVIVDVTGHGESPANGPRWEFFLRDIAALASSLNGDVYAIVAHSAGGLATMAARKLKGLRARKYVCICAPSHPYPPIRAIQAKLNPRASALELCKAFIAEQFPMTWDELQSGAAFANAGADLLLCYDEKDRFVDHTEGDRIHALCPGSRLVKTKQFGHLRILSAASTAEHIGTFLRP